MRDTQEEPPFRQKIPDGMDQPDVINPYDFQNELQVPNKKINKPWQACRVHLWCLSHGRGLNIIKLL